MTVAALRRPELAAAVMEKVSSTVGPATSSTQYSDLEVETRPAPEEQRTEQPAEHAAP